MFTIAQIEQAYSNVKSAADFPAYVHDLRMIGVAAFETFVEDGHTDYSGVDGFRTSSGSMYATLSVSAVSNAAQFKEDLIAHQNGRADFLTFCKNCADCGVEKWIVSVGKMTCIYYDKTGNAVLVETIPQ